MRLFNARDQEAFVRCCDPEVAYQPGLERAMEGRETTVFQGHAGIRRWWREMEEDWSDWSSEIGEIRELHDTLFVNIVLKLRARASGIAFEASFAQVFTIRNGLILSGDDYLDRAAGLEAAGFSEQGVTPTPEPE
jgi:ketosteroid isomerase-like protein